MGAVPIQSTTDGDSKFLGQAESVGRVRTETASILFHLLPSLLKTTPHSINYLSTQLSGAKKMFMFMTLMLWLVLILVQFFYDIKH